MYKFIKTTIALFIVVVFGSCKLNTKNSDTNADTANFKVKANTFFTMQKQDSVIVDNLEKRVLQQIRAKNFEALLAEADTSFSNNTTVQELRDYFGLLEKYYGTYDTIMWNGAITNPNFNSIHKMVKFSSGDSIQLHISVILKENNLKVVYVNYSKLQRFGNSKNLVAALTPSINNLLKKEYEAVYDNCSDNYKLNNKQENISKLWDKHFTDENVDIKNLNIFPLIFAKGKIGVVVQFEKNDSSKTAKKVQIVYYLNKQQELKIEDIRVSR